MLGKPRILSLFLTRLIKSRKHKHSCKILYFLFESGTYTIDDQQSIALRRLHSLTRIIVVGTKISPDICADPGSFVRGGPILALFLVDEGREDPNTTMRGSSSARRRNAI